MKEWKDCGGPAGAVAMIASAIADSFVANDGDIDLDAAREYLMVAVKVLDEYQQDQTGELAMRNFADWCRSKGLKCVAVPPEQGIL